jgi:hypothetical protein
VAEAWLALVGLAAEVRLDELVPPAQAARNPIMPNIVVNKAMRREADANVPPPTEPMSDGIYPTKSPGKSRLLGKVGMYRQLPFSRRCAFELR